MTSPSPVPLERMPVVFLSRPIGASLLVEDRQYEGGRFSEMDAKSAVASVWRELLTHQTRSVVTHLPKAVLVVSSSWTKRLPTVTAGPTTKILYDYNNGTKDCYDVEWDRPGAPGLAKRVQELLTAANIECDSDEVRGLDHGAFLPVHLALGGVDETKSPYKSRRSSSSSLSHHGGGLTSSSSSSSSTGAAAELFRGDSSASTDGIEDVMSQSSSSLSDDLSNNNNDNNHHHHHNHHPQTSTSSSASSVVQQQQPQQQAPLFDLTALQQVPVVELSIMSSLDTDEHLALGLALSPLRDEGVLIIGSGNITQPLAYLGQGQPGHSPAKFALNFDEWIHNTLTIHVGMERAKILSSWRSAPGASECHVKGAEGAMMPLCVCVGAAGRDRSSTLHSGWALGLWSLAAYAWGVHHQEA